MTEREFRGWLRFAQQRLMPSQRIEAYLAQIASVVAQSVGSDVNIRDFILDFGAGKKAKPTKEDMEAAAEADAIAFGPAFKLGKGRKKKAT